MRNPGEDWAGEEGGSRQGLELVGPDQKGLLGRGTSFLQAETGICEGLLSEGIRVKQALEKVV